MFLCHLWRLDDGATAACLVCPVAVGEVRESGLFSPYLKQSCYPQFSPLVISVTYTRTHTVISRGGVMGEGDEAETRKTRMSIKQVRSSREACRTLPGIS